MGIFKRLVDVLKANINDMISKAEDPEKMLNQMIMDMNEKLVEVKQEVAKALADEKRLQRQAEEERRAAQGWEKKAMLAVEKGDDNLAMEALKRQKIAEQNATGFEDQYQQQKAAVDKLKTALRQLNDKIEEARRKKNLLIARAKRAKAQDKINKTMASLTDNSAFDTFSRMEEKVANMEARADAELELNQEMGGQNLEDKFKKLEAEGDASDMLAALKAKMNKA
jgi:phage shock protein A